MLDDLSIKKLDLFLFMKQNKRFIYDKLQSNKNKRVRTMDTFIVATKNQYKLEEIKAILEPFSFQVYSLKDLNISDEIEEIGQSFHENALIKARAIHKKYKDAYVFADDSGILIDLLGGTPGIYSSRFGGINTPYEKKIELLWNMLAPTKQEDWTAKYMCAIALITPEKKELSSVERLFIGQMNGVLLNEAKGLNGFGYDPIFYVPEYDQTAAEMEPSIKNKISHRGKALHKMINYLNETRKNHV